MSDPTYPCLSCIVTNCPVCISLTQCSPTGCDTANQYFYNPANGLCPHCTPTNCLTCASLTTCSPTGCDTANRYFYDPTDSLCYACTPTNCITCISITQCDPAGCDTANGYMYNPADQLCYLCTTSITNCQTCTAYMDCSVCVAPFVLNATVTTSAGQCIPCPFIGCSQCLDINSCQTCDIANNYGVLAPGC